jgi:lysophospholipase L1-like esterase
MQPARRRIADYQRDTLPSLGVEWHDSMSMTADLPTRDGVHYRSAQYATWAERAMPLILDGVQV